MRGRSLYSQMRLRSHSWMSLWMAEGALLSLRMSRIMRRERSNVLVDLLRVSVVARLKENMSRLSSGSSCLMDRLLISRDQCQRRVKRLRESICWVRL